MRHGILLKTISALAVAAVVGGLAPLPAKADTEIRFSWWGGPLRNQKTDDILKLFEKDNPGIKVARETADFQPHWDKLAIQAAAGNQPCTIQMQSRFLAQYAKPNVLLPLEDLVKSGKLDVRGIADTTLKTATGDDGHLYFIPSGVFYFALMYNKTWLDKAGLKVPEDGWKWSELPDLLRKIKPVLPAGAYASHNLSHETDSFVTWIGAQGYTLWKGREAAFPAKVVEDYLSFWDGLRKEGLTNTADVMVQENGSLIEQSNLSNGRTFITARPPNRLDSMQKALDAVRKGEELGAMPYPRGPQGKSGMDFGSNGIAIGATCKDPAQLDAAIKWVNFFTQDDRAAAIYESDNGVVAIDRQAKSQAESPKTSRGQREQILLFQKLVSTANPVAWPANGNANITTALAHASEAVAFEQLKPAEAAAQFMSELKDLMKK